MENGSRLPDNAQPAAYSPTSTPELESKIIFENHLNKKLVKPHLTDNDKTPNFDGYLAITNVNGVPVAKIDVQLKTLPEKFYSTPRFSFDRSFVSACHQNLNPPILVAVNIRDRIVYWHHVDLKMIKEFFSVPDRATHTVPFLPQNVIDGTNTNYIKEWQILFDRALADKLNSDAREARVTELEEQAKKVEKYIEIAQLPEQIVEEAHVFLDLYNSILERDFQAIRKILYPKIWKLGIALGKYTPGSLSHMLLPIPLGKNDPLILRFKHLPDNNLTNLFFSHGIRSLVMHETKNPIRQYPLKYAFELLKDDVLKTIEKNRFPIDELYAANEYLIGFVEYFLKYFGYDPLSDEYDLADLDALLKIILPSFEATNRHYVPGRTQFDHFIDSYPNDRFRKSNHAALEITREKLRNGYIPPLQITLRSQKFDLELVFYYIRFLLSAGKSKATRVLIPMRQENGTMVSKGGSWDRTSMLSNLETFAENYSNVYTGLVRKNFPLLSQQLQLDDEFDLTIFVLPQEKGLYGQPFFTKYYFKAVKAGIVKQRLFCLAEDCPIDPRRMFKTDKYFCTIGGEEYEMKRVQNQHLDFMFSQAPVFEHVHEVLGEKMKTHLESTMKSFR